MIRAGRGWLGLLAWGTGLVGCAGGQTGDNGDTAGGVVCESTTRPIELDEDTGLGYTAGDLLALAEGTHVVPLHYRTLLPTDEPYAPVEDVPADVPDSELTIEVSYVEGSARYRDFDSDGHEGPVAERPDACSDVLELDVNIHMQSADGRIDENVLETGLQGGPTGVAVGGLTFSPYGVAGAVSLSPDLLGRFPLAAPQCESQWPVASDEGMVTANEALALLEDVAQVRFERQTRQQIVDHEPGAMTSGTLHVTDDLENLCGAPMAHYQGAGLGFDALLSLPGDDERDPIPVRVSASMHDSTSPPYITLTRTCRASGPEFIEKCGGPSTFPGVADIAAFDHVEHRVEIEVRQKDDGSFVLEGHVSTWGETPDCELAEHHECPPDVAGYGVTFELIAINIDGARDGGT
jgi:hypothetical protein